jgi:hypothetical protein
MGFYILKYNSTWKGPLLKVNKRLSNTMKMVKRDVSLPFQRQNTYTKLLTIKYVQILR